MGGAVTDPIVQEEADLTGFVPARSAPRNFVESIAASFEAHRRISNSNARTTARDELWNDRIDEVEAVTGVRLPHPDHFIPERFFDEAGRMLLGATDEDAGEDSFVRNARYVNERIEELRRSRPEYGAQIRTQEQWEYVLRDRIAELDENAANAGPVSGFVGAVGASFTDPLNLATLPVGGGAKSVLSAAAQEAGINAVLEVGILSVEDRWRQEIGLDDITLGEAGLRVAAGATFGGIVGGGGRFLADSAPGAIRGLADRFGRLDPERQAAALRDLAPDDANAQFIADGLDREVSIDNANPGDATPAGRALHTERVNAAMENVRSREPLQADLFDDLPPARPAEIEPAPAVARYEEPDLATVREDVGSLRETQRAIAEEADRAEDTFATGLFEAEEMGGAPRQLFETRTDIEARLDADAHALDILKRCPAL